MPNQYVTSADVKTFEGKSLISVTVGIATAILQFDEGLSITVQHGFEYRDGRFWIKCEGGWPNIVNYLLNILNDVVLTASLNEDYGMSLEFQSGKWIVISSSGTGYESYVLNGEAGPIPVY